MKVQNSFQVEKNKLYIVSTPIGNLSDMTFRAIETLKEVDLVLCEDTRVTSKLLMHFEIKAKLESYQKYNETLKADEIISKIKDGLNVALVSDAGTPLVNDPGFTLVRLAVENEIDVVPIPGASAMLSALSASGLVPQPFTFVGFLPKKQSEIEIVLSKYVKREETVVFYESPLRISKTLRIMYDVLGERKCVLAREITKKFETFYRGMLSEMHELEFDERGEYVILLEGHIQTEKEQTIDIDQLMGELIASGREEKEALKIVAKKLGVHKSEVYKAYKIK
ncbi:16S rRNA (cytidine(1402)-2'-O)-methyltransferase [Acholeplasma hippikon]|uniref:16S rRNA (cytidine(1402)-2'-O)-methyltransferase n=1 Tax=Acholeplasma hippikon TaxID=264636 RepID=UPI00138E1084|nr:16S rRNA (cytidine(1402)-2'-O)-methyltransferase [Acholeplasma hippikon]